jgi:hypothetical protein
VGGTVSAAWSSLRAPAFGNMFTLDLTKSSANLK